MAHFLYVTFGIIADILLMLSGNYGGALGANAVAKGLEGNKSLRVYATFTFTFLIPCIRHWEELLDCNKRAFITCFIIWQSIMSIFITSNI